MIKAKYMYKDEVVGWIKFDETSDYTKDILDAAPAKWDACVWDNGEVKPAMRKKRKLKPLEEAMENTVSDDE